MTWLLACCRSPLTATVNILPLVKTWVSWSKSSFVKTVKSIFVPRIVLILSEISFLLGKTYRKNDISKGLKMHGWLACLKKET